MDVQHRFEQLSTARPELRLYALVDGLQYRQHTGYDVQPQVEPHGPINRALFDGTEDAALAHAGPWLFDVSQRPDLIGTFAALETALPSVSWLICALDLQGLAQLLQLKLHARLDQGQTALLRFYDPRVLGNLFAVMTEQQKAEFFFLIDEWHFLHGGQRVWTGRQHA